MLWLLSRCFRSFQLQQQRFFFAGFFAFFFGIGFPSFCF